MSEFRVASRTWVATYPGTYAGREAEIAEAFGNLARLHAHHPPTLAVVQDAASFTVYALGFGLEPWARKDWQPSPSVDWGVPLPPRWYAPDVQGWELHGDGPTDAPMVAWTIADWERKRQLARIVVLAPVPEGDGWVIAGFGRYTPK